VYDSVVAGIPQLREAGWLVAPGTRPDDQYPVRLLLVRTYEQMEDSHGWTVEVRETRPPSRKTEGWFASEAEARAAEESPKCFSLRLWEAR
jgi:hypothetical protein